MKSKLIYLGLMLATAYVYIMFDSDVPLVVLGFEVILPVFLLLTLLVQRMNLKPDIRIPVPVVQKGQKIRVEIIIKNEGFVPAGGIMFRAECRDSYGYKKDKIQISGLADGRDTIVYHYEMEHPYCGRLLFSLPKIRIWDYLKIFSLGLRCGKEESVNVLPDFHEMSLVVTPASRNFLAEGDEYDKNKSGDDVSEIFQVREFRNGDTLQRVHWKMSAKADELMTKEYSLPRGCSVLFLLDFRGINGKIGSARRMDCFIEAAASIMFAMTEQECHYYVYWYEDGLSQGERMLVQDEEQLYDVIGRMLLAKPFEGDYDLLEAYRAEYREAAFSVVLKFGLDLKLWKNSALEKEFTEGALGEQFAEFELEI